MRPFIEIESRQIKTGYYDSTHEFPSHYHHEFEIFYCFSGSQKITVGSETVVLNQGEACIFFPYIVHEYHATPELDCEAALIVGNTSLLVNVFPDILFKQPKNPKILSNQISPETDRLFRSIMNTKSPLERLGYTCLIVSEILKQIEFISSQADTKLISVITSYIDTNFHEPLTINAIAKQFGYHPSYIAHIFCDSLKIPFRTYLNSVRCEYAAEQIRSTKKSLAEIAFESGFGTLSTFDRAFKKNFLQTPTQYKKNLK